MEISFGLDGGFVIFSGNKPTVSGGSVEIENKTKKSRRRNFKNSVDYQDFAQLKCFTKDTFWINFLEDATRGCFPNRYKFNGEKLVYKYQSKQKVVEIKPSTKETFEKLKQFLWETSCIESPIDSKNRSQNLLTRAEAKAPEISWDDIRKSPNLINLAISSYAAQIKNNHNLTDADLKVLFYAVKSLISSGVFSKDNFRCENGKLVEIKGLEYDPKLKRLVLDNNYLTPKEVCYGKNKPIDFTTNTLTNQSTGSYESVETNKTNFISLWNSLVKKMVVR